MFLLLGYVDLLPSTVHVLRTCEGALPPPSSSGGERDCGSLRHKPPKAMLSATLPTRSAVLTHPKASKQRHACVSTQVFPLPTVNHSNRLRLQL